MTAEQAQQQGNFASWCILEIFGHQRYAGYVTTQAFGTAVMFRLDVPALEERERCLERPTYIGIHHVSAGSTVKQGAVQGYTKLFGVGAIYGITPCTKEAALQALEDIQERPLMLVSTPTKALAGGDYEDILDPGDDDEEEPRSGFDPE